MTTIKQAIAMLTELDANMSKNIELVSESPIHPLLAVSDGSVIATFPTSTTWNAEAFVAFPEAVQLLLEMAKRLEVVEEALRYIGIREDYTFAECTEAETICAKAREALSSITAPWKGK